MSTHRKVNDTDISKLKDLLSGTNASVLVPADEAYAASIARWSRAAEKPAGISVVPTTAEEVAIAVKYATESKLDLAVKGGGHSTAGASSTDGGLLIDLGKMRNVKVDSDQKLLYVEGGCLWGDVDEAAWKHGLATVGGTVADTGVGGLTLGGGYGHLSGKYGLVIDNVVGATVVLADGEIKKTSKDENPDLFWALLGAGQNFGVTTQFVLKAYHQDKIYAGVMIFPPAPEIISKLVDAVNDLYQVKETPEGPQTKAKGRCITLLAIAKPPPAGGQTLILVIGSFNGTEEDGKQMYKPFVDIGPLDNTFTMHPYPNVNNLIPTTIGLRSSMKGAAFVMPLRAGFVSEVQAKYDEFIASNQDAAPSFVAWEFYDSVKVTSSDIGSYANRGNHMNALALPTWTDVQNDSQCRQWARDISNMFKTEIEAHGEEPSKGVEGGAGIRGHKGAVMLYGNYDQYDERSKDVFGDNYPRLQKLKAQYDPNNMFNKLFAITPAADAA